MGIFLGGDKLYIEIESQGSRRAQIDHLCSHTQRRDQVPFREQLRETPRIRIEERYLVYRMNNKRTRVKQLEHVQENGKPSDFFRFGQESDEAQNVQHGVLLKLAKVDRANIYRELEFRGQQLQPITITCDGVVVDGNRRLAAMRDLLNANPEKYSGFKYVDAIVLPAEAQEADLATFEAQLQMVPNLKLDYGWVETRLAIRDLKDEAVLSDADIVKVFRFGDVAEMNACLRQLELAEEFLTDHFGQPEAYGQVSDMEQFFKDLQQTLASYEDHTDLRRLVGFTMAAANKKGVVEGRLYDYNNLFGRDFIHLIERYIEEENLADSIANESGDGEEAETGDDPLNPANFEPASPLEVVRPILSDPEQCAKVAPILVEIGQSIEDERQDEKNKQAPLKKIRAIDSALKFLMRNSGEGAVRKQVKSELATLSDKMKVLMDKL